MILDNKLSNKEIIVLDGATGSEIARLGAEMNSSAWCGVANKTHPEIVRQVHEEYIRAGADIITANTFSTSRHCLAGADLADESIAITTKAVQIAREAVENIGANRPIAIAGSMSNMVAWIPGTVSPDPRFLPTPEEELDNYRELAQTLANSGVDILLMEMMRDIDRSTRAVKAAVETGLPVWIGTSCTLLPNGSVSAWNSLMEEPEIKNEKPKEIDDDLSFLKEMKKENKNEKVEAQKSSSGLKIEIPGIKKENDSTKKNKGGLKIELPPLPQNLTQNKNEQNVDDFDL